MQDTKRPRSASEAKRIAIMQGRTAYDGQIDYLNKRIADLQNELARLIKERAALIEDKKQYS